MGSKSGKKKKKWPRRIAVVLVVVVVAAAAYKYFLGGKSQQTVNYASYTASIGSISNALNLSGNLSLIDSATYTAQSATTVRTIYVSEGDAVREGDRLMRLANGQTISAEFDGRVNQIKVKTDDDVNAGDALIQIADFQHLKVSVSVDEYDISDVSVGTACRITTTATEQTYESSIASIDYISASSGSVANYNVIAYVDVDDNVYPGMQVTMTIPQEEAENVVVLKVDALSFDETNQAFVWMKNTSGQLERADVEVGVSNGNYIEIVSGLSDGDEVFAESKDSSSAMGGIGALLGSRGGGVPGGGSMPDGGSMPSGNGGRGPNGGD